jgi:peptidyl-prolyl cis-trans isomerase SurA
MRWHGLMVASGLIVALTALGCESDRFTLGVDPNSVDPKALVNRADDSPGPAVSRMQKADHEAAKTSSASKPKSPLDQSPKPTGDAASGETISSIRALVNDVPIFDEEVRSACATLLARTRDLPEPDRTRIQSEILHNSLEQLVQRELVIQDAMSKLNQGGKRLLEKVREAAGKEFDRQINDIKKQTGVKTDEEFQEFLRRQGISLSGMKRQSERQFIASEYMRSRVMLHIDALGHEDIYGYYLQHPEEFQIVDGVKWQDLFIDANKQGRTREQARQLADEIVGRLRNGAKFEEFASSNDGETAFREGQGYGTVRGEIQPREAEPILFQLTEGAVGPVIELPTGFHVIRLVHRDRAGKMPFDENTQIIIRDKLRKEIATRESQRILDELKRKAQIDYCNTVP